MSIKLSIVICTYNRSKYLLGLLSTFDIQTLALNLFEILIVDNNSTDETKEIANNFIENYENGRYIFERRQGLSNARNRGWKEAAGEYVFYIDDDCLLLPEWLEVVYNIANEVKPDVFGGPYQAYYDYPRPLWVKDKYWSTLHLKGDKPRWVKDEWFSGGCFGIKRSLLAEFGGFDPDYGMSGGGIRFAEEIELQMRIRDQKPQSLFYYSPSLLVQHHVRKEKTRLSYQMTSRLLSARDYYKAVSKSKDIEDLRNCSLFRRYLNLLVRLGSLIKVFIDFCVTLTLKMIFRDRLKYPYYQNYWYEVIVVKASRIATGLYRLKTIISVLLFGFKRARNE